MGVEIVKGVHRIEAEVGGRPLYLFAFLGERRLLLDAGCASTVDGFIVPFLEEAGTRAAATSTCSWSPIPISTTRAGLTCSSGPTRRCG